MVGYRLLPDFLCLAIRLSRTNRPWCRYYDRRRYCWRDIRLAARYRRSISLAVSTSNIALAFFVALLSDCFDSWTSGVLPCSSMLISLSETPLLFSTE